ncbi:MAG TPA: DUF6452 family protein [Ohtaekwangia sp.]|nr:DUF6452 family protein [Ohtaekwangia sp.]
MGTEFALDRVNLSLQPQLQTVKKTSWFIFLLFLSVSCLDDPDCFRLNNNFVGIAFRVMGSSTLDTVAMWGIESKGSRFDNYDTMFVTSVELELDYFSEQTEFIFKSLGKTNRLTLGYQVQTQFVSEDCGPRYILSDLTALSHDFEADSIRVVAGTPSRSGGRHIEIYRCPHPDSLSISFKQLTLAPAATTQSSRFAGVEFENIMVDETTPLYVDKRATTVRLPVNKEAQSTTYTFNFKDAYGFETPQRKLRVSYEATKQVRYKQCGEQTFITKIVTDPAIAEFDSIRFTLDENDLPRNALTDPMITNLEIFRCPVINMIQLSFRDSISLTSTRQDTVDLAGIRTNYNEEVYYADSTVSIIQLPLNPAAASTIFFIDYQEEDGIRTETITLEYLVSTVDFYRNACGETHPIITELALSEVNNKITIRNPNVQYPPITNLEIISN